MLKRIWGIRKILVILPWYWQKYFSICLCIKRTIHKNHWPRLKKLGGGANNTREQKETHNKFPKDCFQKEEKS
jgi:hypothetical protein